MAVIAPVAGPTRHGFSAGPSRPAARRGHRGLLRAFPGARLARVEDAPRRCPTCGGPWRRLQASLACLTCPTELYVAADLGRIETGGAA